MRNYGEELEKRVEFIRNLLRESGAKGIIFGNSGGKDSALVSIICKKACDNTVGIQMPCFSKRNFGEDLDDALAVAEQFDIETRTVNLTDVREVLLGAIGDEDKMSTMALANIAPRLRMTTLYTIAANENRLVAGTGNRSETYMGYFTKHGDGACDFNPIIDLTVREIYEFLEYLGAPESIIKKAPSGGLFDGQTDEAEMGITYEKIDNFLLYGEADEESLEIINRFHRRSEHKRRMPAFYEEK